MAISAEFFAAQYHKGQVYDGSLDYFSHHVASVAHKYQMIFGDDAGVSVAFLHDVVEDTDCEMLDIYMEFTADIATAVDSITKRNGETYMEYIARCSMNSLAARVKLCDSICNMEYSIKKCDYRRAEKYAKNVGYISRIVGTLT